MISDTKIPVLLLAVAMLLGCGQPSGEDAVADHAVEADDLRKQVSAKKADLEDVNSCLLYTSPSPRDKRQSRMPSSA